MTAECTGKTPAEGIWKTLKLLRDRWFVLAFAASALFWARDTYQSLIVLPERVAAVEAAVGQAEIGIAALDARLRAELGWDRSPAIRFGDSGGFAGSGAAGTWIAVAFPEAEASRGSCRLVDVRALMSDATGRWHRAQRDGIRPAATETGAGLAYEVRVHREMARGHASLVLELIHDCFGRHHVDRSPMLSFEVLRD